MVATKFVIIVINKKKYLQFEDSLNQWYVPTGNQAVSARFLPFGNDNDNYHLNQWWSAYFSLNGFKEFHLNDNWRRYIAKMASMEEYFQSIDILKNN